MKTTNVDAVIDWADRTAGVDSVLHRQIVAARTELREAAVKEADCEDALEACEAAANDEYGPPETDEERAAREERMKPPPPPPSYQEQRAEYLRTGKMPEPPDEHEQEYMRNTY